MVVITFVVRRCTDVAKLARDIIIPSPPILVRMTRMVPKMMETARLRSSMWSIQEKIKGLYKPDDEMTFSYYQIESEERGVHVRIEGL